MRILVTGASRGIGRAVCLRLADNAAKGGDPLRLAACGASHGDDLNSLAAEVRRRGGEVVTLLGDLGDETTPRRLVDEAVKAFGGLDGLISNAGISSTGSLLDLAHDAWARLFDVNLRATWLLAKAAHGALAQSRGAIVTVASVAALGPMTGLGAYSVSKAALLMLTRLMAQEWATDGIRANAVSPGWVETPMTARNYADPDFRARREAVVPQRRIATPLEDIAGVVAFLVGPDSGYCTGQNIVADGGLADCLYTIVPARDT